MVSSCPLCLLVFDPLSCRQYCGSLTDASVLTTMQCSWKSMVLLALASIAIQYTAIRTFSTKPLNLCRVGHAVNCSLRGSTQMDQEKAEASDRGCDESLSNGLSSPSAALPSSNSSKRTHILILATTRSGSSFVGQLFNQHPEVRI